MIAASIGFEPERKDFRSLLIKVLKMIKNRRKLYWLGRNPSRDGQSYDLVCTIAPCSEGHQLGAYCGYIIAGN